MRDRRGVLDWPEVMRANLHVHSTFSDGLMKPAEIVNRAVGLGLTAVGFADHFRSQKLPRDSALSPEGVIDYVETLRRLGREFEDRIAVYAGLEICFVLLATDMTSLGLGHPDDITRDLDFVLFEYVSDPHWQGLDLAELLKIRHHIRGHVGLAHCDIELAFAPRIGPEDLARLLARNRIFVELCPAERNSRSFGVWSRSSSGKAFTPYYRVRTPYTHAFFRAARQEGVAFTIGTDTHASAEELTALDDAVEFLYEQGLEERVLRLDPPGT